MAPQHRLSRSEVIERLREHAARVGAASPSSLARHDPIVLRSLRLHFPTFDAARRAARVPAGRPPVAAAKQRRSAKEVWSRERVVDELRRLDREGSSTGWADLMESGHRDLAAAAAAYAGGLAAARAEAGIERPVPRRPVPRWNKATIVAAIRARVRKRQTLASSKAPQRFVAAARWHFGTWEAALAAAGVDAQEVRLRRAAYTRPEIIALVRRLAGEGQVVRAATLKPLVKLDAVRRLFGSVAAAIRAAGGEVTGAHGNQKWSRETLIEELRARAKRGQRTLTPGLHRAAQRYFGGAPAAREAARIPAVLRAAWTKPMLIAELQRRARRGDSGSRLGAACKRLFGSVAAARRAAGVPATQRAEGMAAWGKSQLLAELRRRVQQRLQLSRGLSAGLRRQFGSLAAARAEIGLRAGKLAAAAGAAAGRATARDREPWRRWSHEQIVEKLQAWSASGGPLRKSLRAACRQHFGSVAAACAAANVRWRAVRWTPARIRRALREPSVDAANPAFVAACIEHFGSVTAARSAAARGHGARIWSKATVIAELRSRAGRGLKGVGRLLREPAVRLFGSTEAALQAAAARSSSEPRPRRTRAADEASG